MATIYINNDHTMCLEELRIHGHDDDTGTLVTDAAVTATMLDKNYEPIAVSPWPLTLIHQGEGHYTAPIPDEAEVELGKTYQMRLDADINGTKGRWFEQVSVKRRNF